MRYSYWPYKEPIDELLKMERGEGEDSNGQKISRFVFSSQWMQKPRALGGNIIHGQDFVRYKVLPRIKYRKVFADTAQKTDEHNDYSVFQEWGHAADGRIYLIDMIRGKWESPELRSRAIAIWAKCKARDVAEFGQIRKMCIEDKSSGTGLIQELKLPPHNIPVQPVECHKDRLVRVTDALPYVESGSVCIPEDAPFTNDFITENESFTADDTHEHDDQIDPWCMAVQDMLYGTGNKLKTWESLGKKEDASGTTPAAHSNLQLLQRIRLRR